MAFHASNNGAGTENVKPHIKWIDLDFGWKSIFPTFFLQTAQDNRLFLLKVIDMVD